MPKSAKLGPEELVSLVWLAAAQAGRKESVRKAIQPGCHRVELEINGRVNDLEKVQQRLEGAVKIGPDTTMIKSSLPDLSHLLALFLMEVPKTRHAKLLRELPEEFGRTQELPEAASELIEACRRFAERMRAKTEVPKAGALNYRYTHVV